MVNLLIIFFLSTKILRCTQEAGSNINIEIMVILNATILLYKKLRIIKYDSSIHKAMPKNLLLLFSMMGVCFFTTQPVKSQLNVSGIIRDNKERPLQFASVMLLKSVDSSLVKGLISDVAGKYLFENVQNGQYLITATSAGMTQAYSQIFEVATGKKEVNPETLYLRDADIKLKDVIIGVKKPMYEQKIDRMIINVKNSIANAGGTALDVLEKSPGVTVNRQNNTIAINGKSGVVVMLNGKITYMTMDALVQLLAATSADNIDKIELITTPPSKYDAEGNAGYINIVLINNPNKGFSGSYFLTAGYGKKEVGAAGVNFNYRNSRVNLYGNYSFKYDHYIQPSTGFTRFLKAADTITNTSFSDRDAIRKVQNMRVGLDYQADTSTLIGVLISGYVSHWSMTSRNGATISKNNVPDTTISTFATEINHWQSLMTNLNFQHKFGAGKTLYLDANYVYYKDNNPNNYSNTYYDKVLQFLSHEDLKSDKVTPINFRVFSSDYITPLSKKITMEAGAKISLSRFTNEVNVSKLDQGAWIPDKGLSAKYLLKENIAGAYTSFNIDLYTKMTMKAGLRYEYTATNLGTVEKADIVNRKYSEIFPSLFVSQKLNDGNAISFSYSRRITRPAFTDLAPFTIFFDPKTFFNGNPALQPAIANTVQINYSLKNYIFSLSYSHEKNTIENFYFQTKTLDTINNIIYLSASNFKYEQYLTASFSLPFVINKWWSMQNNIIANWRQIASAFENSPSRLDIFDYKLNSTQRFTFPANLSLELTGSYYSASYFGTTKFQPLYQLNIGLQKELNSKRDVLRLTATDIFNSGSYVKIVDKLTIRGAIVNRSFNYGNVAYKLSYTHSFGNKSLNAKKERSTGAEDELKRVQN